MAPVDPEMAAFLHWEIESQGVDLRLGVALNSIQFHPSAVDKKTGYLSLKLGNGDTAKTELLIMAVGVRPETSLAQEAGLTIGPLVHWVAL